MANITVKKSRIEGKGIFAARNFKQGDIILKWNPRVLTTEQAKQVQENKKRYLYYSKGKHILMHAPEKYVNHSCEANTYVKAFCDIAKRNIKKGEGITSDYAKAVGTELNMKCNCGSKACRRIIRKNKSTKKAERMSH
ncbi:MAG: hypothetical protein NT129_05785 [Candidatus Aenigmarchaeota archaeon]|nr:hypothetical protein [Candidatus Aenigmarchaeota archaeon]